MDEDTKTEVRSETGNTFRTPEEIASDKPDISEPVGLPENRKQEKPKKSKKPLVFVSILLLILFASGAWFFIKKKPTNTQNNQQQTTVQTPANSNLPSLFGVVYAYGDAEKAGMELFWRPVTGGDRRSARNIGQKNYVASSDVYKNEVVVTTVPGQGSSDGETIWYSEDSGQTYEKLFSLELPSPEKEGDQITSAIFSKDGKSIVYALLLSGGKTSVVWTMDVKAKQPKDLLTINGTAVFLVGYDSQSNKLYYNTGCTNCDGSSRSKLFESDIATKQETLVYDLAGKFGEQQLMSEDYNKVLVLTGSASSEGLGGGPPYQLKEFNMTSKVFKDLYKSADDSTPPQVGYRNGDSLPYYSEKNNVYVLKDDGTKVTVFEASKPIVHVLYVGQDAVIAGSGTAEDYALTNLTISTKSIVEVLKGDQSTSLVGVTFGK